MPVNFDALKHPRDKRGRFTKSRTVLASSKDKKLVKEISGGFTPAKTGDGTAYAGKIADPGQHKPARDFAVDAKEINEDLRAGHADAAGVKPMDDAMRPLPEDLVLHRSVPATAFGGLDPQSLQGMKVRDAGFTSTQLDPAQPAHGSVRMFIAAPKGSRAVPNPDTGEVYLDRDSEMVVSHVAPNAAGGHDMYLTVLPKNDSKTGSVKTPDESGARTGGKSDINKPAVAGKPAKADKPAEPGAKPAATPVKPEADKPEGGDKFRASLMKQTVAQLQAQMRERDLKPGKKRKSELVDALVADEIGHDGKKDDKPPALAEPEPRKGESPPAKNNAEPQSPVPAGPPGKAEPGSGGTYETRLGAAATGEDALNAVPLSLVRTDTHARPGKRQGLTAEQRNALLDYQGPAYAPINNRLRDIADGRANDAGADTVEQTKNIDAAMAGSALTRDVVVYRGISGSRKVFGDRVDNDLTGMEWREAAFVSTSALQSVTESFSGARKEPVRMRILAPAGVSAVQVSGVKDGAKYDDEAEILLNRDTRMRVVQDRGIVDGVRHLDVEVVL